MANQLVQFLRQSDPSVAALSDDEITLKYATGYADQFEEVSGRFPDWRSDFDRIMAESAKAQLTPMDYVKNAIGRGVKSAAGAVASLPEAVGIASQGIDQRIGRPGGVGWEANLNSERPLEEYATTKIGGLIRRAGDAIAPETQPALDDSFWASTVPSAVGSMAGMAATGGAAGLARGAATRLAAVGLTGAATMGVEQFKDAMRSGADDKTAMQAFLLGGLVGTSEIVPLNRMLARFDSVSDGWFSKAVLSGIKKRLSPAMEKGVEITAEAAKDAFEEAAQEAFQSASGNAIAGAILKYDTDRRLMDGLAESAAAGGVAGTLMSLLTQAMGKRVGVAGDGQSAAEVVAERDQKPEPAVEKPAVEPDEPLPVGAGLGLDEAQIQALAGRVVAGELDADEALGSIEQSVDKAKFTSELGRMLALRTAMGPAQPAAAPEVAPGVAPEVAEPVIPEVTPEVAPEVTPEVAPAGPIPVTATPPPAPEASESKLDALVASGVLTVEDKEKASEALKEDALFQATGGEQGAPHPEIVQAIANAPDPETQVPPVEPATEPVNPTPEPVPTPVAADPIPTPPPEPLPAPETQGTPPTPPADPFVAAVEAYAGSDEDTQETTDGPARLDAEIAATVARMAELTREGGAYQEQMLRRTDAINDTPAMKELNRLDKRKRKLEALKERASTGSSRDLLFDQDAVFYEATGLEANDATKTGKEAAGVFFVGPDASGDDATLANHLLEEWKAAPAGRKRLDAADNLADHLASQAIPPKGNRKLSRRAAAFRMSDGRVLVTLLKDTGSQTGAKPKAGKNPDGSPKDGAKWKTSVRVKVPKQKGRPGFQSVADLLESGAVPIASIRLAAPRGTLNHLYTAQEFARFREGATAIQADELSQAEAGASDAADVQAASDGTVVADGGELQARSAPSSGGPVRGLEDGGGSAYLATSNLTQAHVAAILEDIGKGPMDVEDALFAISDGTESDDGRTSSAYRSLLLAAASKLPDNEQSPEEARDSSQRLAAEWISQSSAADAGGPGFVASLLAAAGIDPRAASSMAPEATAPTSGSQGEGSGGSASGGQQSAAGTGLGAKAKLAADIKLLLEFGIAEQAIAEMASKPDEISQLATKLREELEWSEEEGRYRRSEPDAPPADVDFASGTAMRSRVTPVSVDGAIANLNRAEPSQVLVAAEAMVGPLREAVKRVATESTNPFLRAVAGSLDPLIPAATVSTGSLSGAYAYWSGSEAVIDPSTHRSAEEVHRSLLHEAVHAATGNLWQMFQFVPETMAPAHRRMMERLSAIIEQAKTAGLKWQDMGDPAAAFDEFLAAVKTDEKFRAQLQSVSGGQSLWSRLKSWFVEMFRVLTGGDRKFTISEIDALVDGVLGGGPSVDAVAPSRFSGSANIARDAEYMAAVQRGDMETAQRMVDEAAKEAGYEEYKGEFISPPHRISVDSIYATETPSSKLVEKYKQAMQEGDIFPPIIYREDGGTRFLEDGTHRVQAAYNISKSSSIDAQQIKSADPATYDDAGKIIPLSQRFNPSSPDIRFRAMGSGPRFRKVDGYLGAGSFESTPDTQFDPRPEAKVAIAVANQMATTYKAMLAAYKAVSNLAGPLTDEAFIKFIHQTAEMGGVSAPDDVVKAVVAELNRQGLPAPGIERTTTADLDEATRRPQAMREAVIAAQRVQNALGSRFKEISDAFVSEVDRLNRLRGDLYDSTKKYDSLDFTQNLLLQDLRRALRMTADRGSGRLLKDMGVSDPAVRKAELDAAAKKMAANPNTFAEAVEALSLLGVDFDGLKNGSTKLADVVTATKASNDPRLAPLVADRAAFALAVNFAKRHSVLMDLLPARSAHTERRALDTMIALALSARPDGFDLAVQQLAQLKRLGARGARILEKLRKAKADFKAKQELVDNYTRVLDAYPEVAPVLQRAIGDMQAQLAAESGAEADSGRQWSPSQGAAYYVPASNSTTPAELLAHGESNPHRKVLDFGSKFNIAQIGEDHRKIQSWLAANPQFQGRGRALLERMVSRDAGLLTAATRNAVHNVAHGPLGMIFRYLGDLGIRLQSLNVHGAREAGRMLRQWDSNTMAMGRGHELAMAINADKAMTDAMKATGIEHPDDFLRRFHHNVFNYLETRADLNSYAPGTPESKVESDALQAIKLHLESMPDTAAILKRNPKAWPAIRDYLKSQAANNSMVQGWIKRLGLKVNDSDAGFFRAPIGRTWFTMSRMVGNQIRSVVRDMESAWEKSLDWSTATTPDEARKLLQGRFPKAVWSQFVLPMAHKTGQSLFDGPEVGGAVDRASRANVIAAAVAADGDFVKFAETLHGLEGGQPADLMPFIKSTFKTVDGYFRQLEKISHRRDHRAEGDEIGRTFLDGRQGSDYPAEWLEYRTFGRYDITRYARQLAGQASFGNNAADFKANLDSAERDLTLLANDYEEWVKAPAGPEKAAIEKRLKATGNWVAYKTAAKNLEELRRISHDFDALWDQYHGDPAEYRALTRTLGTMAGLLVQGVSTTLVDNVTLVESPMRKLGLGKSAARMVAGNINGYAGEFWGSLLQAIGREFAGSQEWAEDTKILNKSGLADPDAFLGGYADAYKAGISGLPSVREAYSAGGLTTAAVNIARRGTEVGSALISTGIGRAKSAEKSYATFKPLAPFTMGSQFQHRAAARGWLISTRRLVRQAASRFRADPKAFHDPGFKFDYESMGGAKFFGVMGAPNKRAWDQMRHLLEQSGISIEDSARRLVNGQAPFTDLQSHAIVALAQSETVLNSSPLTRPTGTTGVRGLIANPIVAPLLGWSIGKTADVAKTTRDPDGQASYRAFGSALTAFLLGILPVSLAFAWLRDEYDEEVVGKKPNVQPFSKENTFNAVIDRMDRIGTFGIAGNVINSIVNYDTARDLSVDSRVLALNTLGQLTRSLGTLIRQKGDVDYAGFYRPLAAGLGGAGYLQNFDAINNLLGMDNQEARVVRRINVSNLIRASAKATGLEARSAKFGGTSPSPIKPYVTQMLLAAYANDAAEFRAARRRAVLAAMDDSRGKVTREEAEKRVASSYAGQNPVTLTLARKPTDVEWRKMLGAMERDQRDAVTSALRNFTHYGEQIGAPVHSITAQPKKPTLPKLPSLGAASLRNVGVSAWAY